MTTYNTKFSPGDIVFWRGTPLEIREVIIRHCIGEEVSVHYLLYFPGENAYEYLLIDDSELEAWG
jgi:hypothetical protein